jgi:hypothetical protein
VAAINIFVDQEHINSLPANTDRRFGLFVGSAAGIGLAALIERHGL